jgi:predicted chitinase
MLTTEQLQSIMPGLSAKRNGEFLPFLQAAMTEFAIEAPARAAAFLAQLAHESGQFRFMEEIWGPTAAQRRYEPPTSLATTLGNTEAGDGKRFKGRGPIQITGRANYRRFGDLLGVDMVSDPARAAVPDLAFRIASLFWSKKGLNELADRATADAFREITRRINGGFNGLEDRKKFYAVACTVLGVSEAPAERGLPVPDAAEEPVFDRGYEAIRRLVPGRRPRKAASAKRKAAPATRKKSTGRAKADTRRAKTGSRKAKSPRGKTRKVAATPRGASLRSRVKTTAARRSAAATTRKTAGARRSKASSAARKRKPARRKS